MGKTLSHKLTEQLIGEETTQTRHLQTMLQISRAIGQMLDPKQLMQTVIAQTTLAFEADRSTLFIHDADAGQLWAQIAQGLEGHTSELRIADKQGLAGHVFQTQESAIIADTFQSRHFANNIARDTGYVPRSMMVVPVSHRPGMCNGVLQVMDARVDYFSQDDIELLEAIAVQVAISLENAHLYAAQKRQFISFVKALSAALDARDPGTQEHSINVANFAEGIGYHMGLEKDELDWLRIAGLVHDIGKIGTPEAILRKPGKLDPDEFDEMKRHAEHSRNILSRIEFINDYKDMDVIASAHHEKLDGSGYPEGLEASQLCLKARILAVADIFHALTQDRHYRPGMSPTKAMQIITEMSPHQLDGDCVQALRKFLGPAIES